MSTTSHATKRAHVAVGATRPAAAAVFGPDHDELDVLDYPGFLAEAGLVTYASVSVAAGEGQGPVLARVLELLMAAEAPTVTIEYAKDAPGRALVESALSAHPAVVITEVRAARGSLLLRLSGVTPTSGSTNAAVLQALALVSSATSDGADTPRKSSTPTTTPPPPVQNGLLSRLRRTIAATGRRGLVPLTAGVLLAALIVLVLLGTVVGVEAVVVALLLVTLAGVAGVGGLLHRGLARVSQAQESQLALQRRTRGLVDRRTAKLSSEYRSPELRNPDLTAVRRYAGEIAAETTRSVVRQQQLHLETQRQLQAQLNLLQLVRLTGAVPSMGGADASAWLHLLTIDALLRRRPSVLVQVGGGTSALLLGLACVQHDLDTKIVVLDEPSDMQSGTWALVSRHGVQDRVEVRDPTDGLADVGHVGVLVITGPFTSPLEAGDRLRSLMVTLTDRLAEDCTIVVDGVLDETDGSAGVPPGFLSEVRSTGLSQVTVWTRGPADASGH